MKIFLDTIRSLIIRSEFLIFLMNSLIKIKNGRIYKKEIEKRSGLNLFDYSSLATPLPYYPNDKVTDNNYYGISNALKEYMHYKGDLDAYIEHGVFLGSVIPKNERLWKISRIITFSENRKKFLLQGGIGLPIIKIGPYIHYAKDFLNEEELKHTKAKIGRTLLVFPSHSIKNVTADYDIQEFITFINSKRNDFDTVLVSLYWLDALNEEIVSLYRNSNCVIVTAGNRFDVCFLSRLKSLIKLADMTISNAVGTHIGYCIYLNRPHYIFSQSVNYIANSTMEEKRFKNVRNQNQEIETEMEETQEIENAFSEYRLEIKDSQREVVEKYWGISEIKSTELLLKEFCNEKG